MSKSSLVRRRRRTASPYFLLLVSVAAVAPYACAFSQRPTPSAPKSRSFQVLLSSRDKDGGVTLSKSSLPPDPASLRSMKTKRRRAVECLQKGDTNNALQTLQEMILALRTSPSENEQYEIGNIMDNVFTMYYSNAFAPPFKTRGARRRVMRGAEAIQLQVGASDVLQAQHATVTKQAVIQAIRALTELDPNQALPEAAEKSVTEAYRLLQRLVTGKGIRGSHRGAPSPIYEIHFNRVLNAYCRLGRMDMAHRVIALQERTPHAPDLSPVTYSILLKGYGRQKSARDVEMILRHANRDQVEPDTIMYNSLIDAYVNCGLVGKALSVFDSMKRQERESDISVPPPRPNRRTYNTILKGLANAGALNESIMLSQEMRERKIWDDITTNTLVQAAVTSQDFELAEEILSENTAARGGPKNRDQHPNVEAYSSLVDGYAKTGELNNALRVLRLTRERGVEPNGITYTCLVGGMARQGKLDEANKLMDFMESVGHKPTAVTYNAYISGLLEDSPKASAYDEDDNVNCEQATFDFNVDKAFSLLKSMIRGGIRPNAITVSVLTEAYGRCSPPRITEAKATVQKLIADGYISQNNNRVMTSLIKTCSRGEDLEGASDAFEKLNTPDTISVNAYLDSCRTCRDFKRAMQIFEDHFNREDSPLRPDVISYSSILSTLISGNTVARVQRARDLYRNMTEIEQVPIDTAFVDVVLKGVILNSKMRSLRKVEIDFLTTILTDAESLEWGDGRLAKRKRAVKAVLSRNPPKSKASELYDVLSNSAELPKSNKLDMFARHGWNEVDSGFRLWGSGQEEKLSHDRDQDSFLKSKGWNNVDSGFRII